MNETNRAGQDGAAGADAVAVPPNPLYGVHGWLRFFVVMNLYVVPVLFVVRYIIAWAGFGVVAHEYPAIIPVGLIETLVGGFLIYRWIRIARRLREIAPGVIREARTWLKLTLGWVVLSNLLIFFIGFDPGAVVGTAIRGIVVGAIAFAVWYSYFKVSKRVRATYPDWDK